MSTEEPPRGAPPGEEQYDVAIIHPWNKDTISVAEIRELGGFPPDCPVIAVHLPSGEEQVLPEDAVHNVVRHESGRPLAKRMTFKRGWARPPGEDGQAASGSH